MVNAVTVAEGSEPNDVISKELLKQVIISGSSISDEAIKETVIGDIIEGAKDKEALAALTWPRTSPITDLIPNLTTF